jgi:hypothetical protein
MKVELHIERVVVDETMVTRADGPSLRKAIEGEVRRLLAGSAPGATFTSAAIPHVQAPQIRLRGDGAVALGRQIGRSVYEGAGFGRPEAR